ncbi:type-F conjugative transfer system protein TraW [Sphingomonas lacusdianchii]|uniref:type-F conjugative transfer system protein TraW n=1 Tax=Sphingomonas lacusdianchii TaxID=2917992 RepID=UPI001F58A925
MIRRALLLGGLLAATSVYPFAREALARDHGVMGQTWGIAEPDLLTTIDAKLKAMQANGSVDRMQAALAAKAEDRVRNPLPVAGIGAVREARSWTFDPSIVLERDIRDQKGRLIAQAGQKVNPLSFVSMKTDLVFIDGRDDAQVEWATKRWSATTAKIIFVAGSPFDRMGEKKRRFFFDQQGKLTGHFGIEHVPAIVTPAGEALKVSEIELPGGAS